MKPARRIITTSPHRSVGAVHASWFQSDPIHHESFLEKGCIELMLLMPMATHIQHQPVKMRYQFEGKEHSHVPDFKLTLAGGAQAIVEVKPESLLDEHRNKFDQCSAQLAQAGIDYYVCTDKKLTDAFVERAEGLRDLARRAVPADMLRELLLLVSSGDDLKVEDALNQGFSEQVIGHAVGRRLLTVGPSLDLSPSNRLVVMDTGRDRRSPEGTTRDLLSRQGQSVDRQLQ